MGRAPLAALRSCVVGTSAALLLCAFSRADEVEDLRQQVLRLSRRVQDLEQQLEETQPVADEPAAKAGSDVDTKAVKKIIADYLKDNPGAGMPPGVQTGYFPAQGFVIRSPADPTYTNWPKDSTIPFALHVRGLLQVNYDFYKVTDKLDHLTGQTYDQAFGDFSQFEVKRARLAFFGTAFTPDLRYFVQLNGSTVGLPGLNNVGQPRPLPVVSGNIPGASSIVADHAVSLYAAYIAYDCRLGNREPCADSPVLTGIIGKYRPFFAFEQYLGDGNQQLVEHGMATFFFDADDDYLQTQAGVQLHALENRLFATVNMSNGNESQTPNIQLDNLPGANGGFWYDFGGCWNEERQCWDLYGSSVSDLAYSCLPVVRAGTMFNLVPMGRRSLYGIAEQSRVYSMPAAPGGSSFISFFDGGGPGNAKYAMDAFDSYSYEAFVAGKYRGFSFLSDWWLRTLTNFQSSRSAGPGGPIVYTIPQADGSEPGSYLFPNHPILDFGMMLQAGYFLIPHRLEVAGRWSWIRGQSGDLVGTGVPVREVTLGGMQVPELAGAFHHFHEADEYTIGLNYYWKGQQLKWQTDFSAYQGGNPAAGGRPLAGYIPGVDGWLLRSQIQLWF